MPESNLTASRTGKPGSRHLLERAMGLGPLREFLDILSIDVAELFDDFTGVALDTTDWSNATSGTGPTAFAVPAANVRGGIVSGNTGTTANNVITLSGPAVFQQNVIFEARINPGSAITSSVFEFGIEAGTHATTTRAVSDVDTPSFSSGVTDVALFHRDTAQTLNTLAAVVKGSATGQSGYRAGVSPDLATSTFRIYAVRINAPDFVEFFIDGERVAAFGRDTDPDGVVSATVLFRPIVRVITLNTTGKDPQVDYIRVIGDRI